MTNSLYHLCLFNLKRDLFQPQMRDKKQINNLLNCSETILICDYMKSDSA